MCVERARLMIKNIIKQQDKKQRFFMPNNKQQQQYKIDALTHEMMSFMYDMYLLGVIKAKYFTVYINELNK